jgi:RND family efflux transporter MFP subunit
MVTACLTLWTDMAESWARKKTNMQKHSMKDCGFIRRSRAKSHELRSLRLLFVLGVSAALVLELSSCSDSRPRVEASAPGVTVGVTTIERRDLIREITLSSELVPFQEIDVYAKEAGYVKNLYVDYGTRVKAGQLIATLEIPELEAQLHEDEAEIKNSGDVVTRSQHELKRYQAQYKVLHLEYSRLNDVFKSQPGIVAQQEVDDAQGKDLAAASQVDAGQAAFEAAQSSLNVAKAKLFHDQTLYDYAKITAPFAGVVTERYANLGTLVQAGTSSSTQAMPIVKLSEDDRFRLVMPVPESYVRYIRIGQRVDVRVPSLGRTFPGKVARFSVDVKESTRTMHTEVDVENPKRLLVPGSYAEADLTLEQKDGVPAVPLQALNHEGDKTTVYVVDANGKIQDRPVTLGLQTENSAEVISGLSEGERVIVSDRSGLKPGEIVRAQTVEVTQYQEGS